MKNRTVAVILFICLSLFSYGVFNTLKANNTTEIVPTIEKPASLPTLPSLPAGEVEDDD